LGWKRTERCTNAENIGALTEQHEGLPYEPIIVGSKLIMPVELQKIHNIVLDAVVVEIVSDEMRSVVERLWPDLVAKLPSKLTT
jgi:hypothetical protein